MAAQVPGQLQGIRHPGEEPSCAGGALVGNAAVHQHRSTALGSLHNTGEERADGLVHQQQWGFQTRAPRINHSVPVLIQNGDQVSELSAVSARRSEREETKTPRGSKALTRLCHSARRG